ncbi:MAG: NADH-quinone oxidoreductase subunit H [Planctomycetes bacterium]|nr:NADH-quinone oxidoreductase subunit H [Planctomycetota bacterium]
MNIAVLIFHLTVMLVAPIFMVGIINRVKSLWAGRRGPRLIQSWFDFTRLLRKTPVYSQATSWIFPLAPYFVLATTITAALIAPVVPGFAIFAFPGDLIAFAYLLAFGRVLLMLNALDTASAFEGMGASREATYSALLEPVLLLTLGTLGCLNNVLSFQDIVSAGTRTEFDRTVLTAIVFALFVLLVVESARVPADDPATHLELTMVHEVMVLDHSGPELGVIQYTAAMKMTVFAMVIAAVINPFSVAEGGFIVMLSMVTSLAMLGAVALVVGLLESLTARLRFRALPLFILTAFIAVVIALVAVVARQGGLE